MPASARLAHVADPCAIWYQFIQYTPLVAIHWTATGNSVPPGGKATKPTKVSGISIFRYEDGKIVESWDIVDRLALFRQLGFTITPPKAE